MVDVFPASLEQEDVPDGGMWVRRRAGGSHRI